MKKSKSSGVPFRKVALIAAAFSCISFACTSSGNKDLEGSFLGTDGSSQLPSQVEWTIALTGDGLVAGTWNSTGEITKGQLSGKLSSFGNELILYAQSGNCTGQFRGDFAFIQGELKGTLKGNSNCPERVYHFDLKKNH